jgi:hypothetical protein
MGIAARRRYPAMGFSWPSSAASNLPKSGTEASNNTIYIHDRAGGSTFIPMYD